MRRGADQRSIDHLRPDIYLDILHGTNTQDETAHHKTVPKGAIDLQVDLSTL
ncbi:MAG: hypothetical protein OEM32_02910 [Acidimicrobiia bacterium]|nr:hypothetical protein [Acidimicrobiia bacterium]